MPDNEQVHNTFNMACPVSYYFTTDDSDAESDASEAEAVEDGINQLGAHFGGNHGDSKDFVVGFTFMHPIGVDDGRLSKYYFCIHDMGVCFEAGFNTIIVFNGLFFHGGSQPTYLEKPAEGDPPAYRLMLVNYATQGSYEFSSRQHMLRQEAAGPERREFE